MCVVGLHCCGDLTPNILRLVSGQVHSDLSAAVVVGCCYHKMTNRGTWQQNVGIFEVFFNVHSWRCGIQLFSN